MKSVPRILPLLGVAVGGVLVVNAVSGARDLPGLLSGAQAFAQEATKGAAPAAKSPTAKAGETAPTGDAQDAAAGLPTPTIAPKAVCAPTAAELAKQAGLSPAELQVLQSLGARRGVLDARENDLSTQLALMAAAEAKLDAKIKALNGLKAEVNGLLAQTDTKQEAEIDRLVKVFENMKAKDAAPRMTALDDSVRIPIAAKMKERSLAAIVAQMPPSEAKKLTEALARRFSDAQAAAERARAVAEGAQPARSERRRRGLRRLRPSVRTRRPARRRRRTAGDEPRAGRTPPALRRQPRPGKPWS